MRLVSGPYILLGLVYRLFPASPRLLYADVRLAVRILPGVPERGARMVSLSFRTLCHTVVSSLPGHRRDACVVERPGCRREACFLERTGVCDGLTFRIVPGSGGRLACS